ncbi:MAG: copper resistance protein B [Gammaproteobacteria bacterium]|jgi:copper resistance protein B|nr:copper resistance protein B [Gammaproteobacteria bacterium]
MKVRIKELLNVAGALLAVLLAVPANAMTSDDPLLVMLKIDQLEVRDSDQGSPLVFDGLAWIGHDLNKVWAKFEAERIDGETEEAELQLLYGRAIAPYWDLQVGWRHDFRPEPERDWFAIGLQGLAPYFFEVDATAFIGEDSQVAFRLSAEYEMMLTQRWVLSPEIEINAYTKDQPDFGIGSGIADLDAGLRLRYEIRREIAPYVGVNYQRKFGGTADLAKAQGEATDDWQWVAGIRAWF